jgi:hypothetical protein
MNRNDFLKKLVTFGLLAILTFIVLALSNRVVTGKDCSVCSGNGVCNGKTDCNKY